MFWPTPWTASTRVFARQMAWLQRHVELVTLAEAQRRIATGVNERPCVHVTFDDGYADNLDFAIPLLVERGIPCTYFVASQFVARQCPFPHDVACNAPLRPNSPEQLRRMAAWGIEIGAHTRTHADLGRIGDADQLIQEIVGSRQELESMVGRPVHYFAFPYGQQRNLNQQAFAVARQHGLLGACSAYGGYNFPGDEPFHIQRIHADNQMLTFKNWLTFDPRKHRSIQRYWVAPESAVQQLEPQSAGEVASL